MRRGRTSLTGRLILLAAVWSLLAIAVTGVALTAFFRQASLSRFQEQLTDLADTLFNGATVDANGEIVPPVVGDPRTDRAYSGRYWQIAVGRADGTIAPAARSRSLFDTELKPPPGGLARLQRQPGEPIYYNSEGPNGEPLRSAAILGRIGGFSGPVVFMTAADRRPVDEDAQRFALTTALALAALAAGLVTAVFIQVRFGLLPLFAMGDEVSDVRTGRAQRIMRSYPSEIQPLADELNALLDHNQEVVERQRTHVGNLAHALKTPLSVMLAEAERDPSPLAAVVNRQAQAMRDHVDHHLRRARAAARYQAKGERTEVAPVLDELAVTLERIFETKGVEIDWRAPDDLCFAGEKQDFLEIAGNVLENACKYARRRVRAATSQAEQPLRFRLVVEDDGPGVPEEKRAEMLTRGVRLDEQAPGSGLGLNIVEELVRAYGGSMTLGESAMGGLRVEVLLPKVED